MNEKYIKKNISTPVLFLIFNRPDVSQRVFNEIKKAKPSKLYVAADGPRKSKEGESSRCEETRKIIEQVDWECKIVTLFREDNLGCKIAVSSAITWFFDHEEEGIILEDDCLPNPTFFKYCEELLNKYRYDERVMHISGDNFQFGKKRGDGSYYFSIYPYIWGWATWRRSWKKYDVNMRSFPLFKKQNQIRNIFENKQMQGYWMRIFERSFRGEIDTWDYQWTYTVWSQGGLSIFPNVNLISNIGHNAEATHTIGKTVISNMKSFYLDKIVDPTFVLANEKADEYFFNKVIQPTKLSKFFNGIVILKNLIERKLN
ncbi:MAG: hypothetical protein NT093_02335 [Candidatus Moranbacteria bacterium]|nr:hypothetical protein [Candidatus Moranbacteria bacterium]